MKNRNNTFYQMEKAALSRLSGISPERISQNTEIPFDRETSSFRFTSLGINVTIHYPDYHIEPYLQDWHHLILLHHLDMADSTLLGEKNISFRELPDGFIRGERFDRFCEDTIRNSIGNYDPEKLAETVLEMGAKITDGKSDFSAVFSLVPRYPLTLNLWFAEEDEIPASGKLLTDSNAGHQLSTEDAVTVGELILERIQTIYKEKS